MIHNPIIPGFNPDPSIIRVGADYYLATSTFEWLPAVQLFHSRDLSSWELVGHVLEGEAAPDLRGVDPSGGVWAPCLSHDPVTGTFYLVYSIMANQTGELFDLENFVVTAPAITGPWSAPKYLTSIGFDASLFHDDDGRKWLVTLEWDPRDGYEHPGAIVVEEFDPVTNTPVGQSVRIYRGGSDRGCLEGPHLYRHDGWYYLLAAEGGTGFGHGVTLARSRAVHGPFEPAPNTPFITSSPERFFGRDNRDFLRTERFDPNAELHKAGHGSLVDTPDGEWFVAHLSARPLNGQNGSILGRETSLQKVEWTDDGWLRLAAGGILAQATTAGISGMDYPDTARLPAPVRDDFDGPVLDRNLATLRRAASAEWADLHVRAGMLRLHGRDSLFSRFSVSLVAARLQSFVASAETVIEFDPTHFSHSAGLTVYYNNQNFFFLRVYFSETLGGRALGLVTGDGGVKTELRADRVALPDGPLRLAATLSHGDVQFLWAPLGEDLRTIGPVLDGSLLSDERLRGFTGTFVGVSAHDGYRRDSFADFDFFELKSE